MNIYESLEIQDAIEELAEQNGGEISDDDFKLLIIAQTNSVQKLENVCKLVKHLEYFVENCKEEKARIMERQRIAENRIESVKRFLNPFILERGKLDAGTFKISNRKSEAVEIDNEDAIPAEYKVIKQIISIDKAKVKEALKSGQHIEGARIAEHNNTQIK